MYEDENKDTKMMRVCACLCVCDKDGEVQCLLSWCILLQEEYEDGNEDTKMKTNLRTIKLNVCCNCVHCCKRS